MIAATDFTVAAKKQGVRKMKKLLSLSILSLSLLAGVSAAEAKTSGAAELNAGTASYATSAQIRRVRTTVRTVRRGRFLYRETYRITTRPNGTVVRRLISRTRIR
jgi:hypothetical protein